MRVNATLFFEAIRKEELFKRLSTLQVNCMEGVINFWNATGYQDIRWLAYMFATIYHETGTMMTPIEEWGKGRGRPYGSKIKHSGMRYANPDKLYYGRGYVQLTWYENYLLMARLTGANLLNRPELALVPDTACRILFEGMTMGSSSFGDFTGKCLEQYFNLATEDPKGARRIINGTDKAALIANLYYRFKKCLA